MTSCAAKNHGTSKDAEPILKDVICNRHCTVSNSHGNSNANNSTTAQPWSVTPDPEVELPLPLQLTTVQQRAVSYKDVVSIAATINLKKETLFSTQNSKRSGRRISARHFDLQFILLEVTVIGPALFLLSSFGIGKQPTINRRLNWPKPDMPCWIPKSWSTRGTLNSSWTTAWPLMIWHKNQNGFQHA